MKTLIKICWRNIWRNRTRTFVIITALILGLMGGNFSAAIRLASEKQRFEDTIENQISHIQIHHPGFIANPEARFRIPEGKKVAEEINERPDIKVVSPRTVFDGMISSANMNAGVRIKGIDPDIEAQTTRLDELLEKGSYFTENGRLPSIVIGRELADKLNSDVGSRLVLTFQDINGEVLSTSFRVEGLYSATSKRFEERTVFAEANIINKHISDTGAVTEIAIVLEDSDDYQTISGELLEAFPDLEIRHWIDIDPLGYYALEILSRSLIWILVIIILAVSFGLLNIILMSILERVRELGVLLAIGMKRARVFSMIVVETTMISIIGGIIGLIMSFALIRVLNIRGLRIPGAEGMEAFGYPSVLYPDIETAFYFRIGLVVIVFAIMASIYPAWKAISLQPAESVKQE